MYSNQVVTVTLTLFAVCSVCLAFEYAFYIPRSQLHGRVTKFIIHENVDFKKVTKLCIVHECDSSILFYAIKINNSKAGCLA